MKARIAIVLTVLGMVLVAVPVVGAATSSGIVGFYNTGSAYCHDGKIHATPPSMLPAANAPWGPTGGGQLLGYRAVLQRLGSAGWYDYRTSNLQLRWAGSLLIFDGQLWTDHTTGIESTGLDPFNMTGLHGYFRVVYRMAWYLNGQVTGWVWNADAYGHFDDRQSTFSLPGARSYYWCLY
jgi:hypothetical protein